jgi:hypothetical protein
MAASIIIEAFEHPRSRSKAIGDACSAKADSQ